MKHLIFAGLIFSVLAGKSKMPSTTSINYSTYTAVSIADSTTIEGRWKLMPVMTSDTAAGKIPEINFNLKTNRFSGNSGCNSMSGTFVINKDALSFNKDIILTKMACPGYNEKAFLESLTRTNRYEIKNGVLQLMYNATVLSKWVRHSDSTISKQI